MILHSFALSQWSDQHIQKINLSDQEDERYKLMDKMSINLKNSDIRNVLTMIGELTGLNIVISPNIEDTITANLEDVTVKAALDAILKPNNYSYFVQDNIIIVKDLDTQLIGELESVVIRLKYINSNDLQAPLSTVWPLGERSSLSTRCLDVWTNGLRIWQSFLMSKKTYLDS